MFVKGTCSIEYSTISGNIATASNGNTNADVGGAFLQQLFDNLDGDMPLNRVALEHEGMAALVVGRNAGILADRGNVSDRLDFNLDALGSEVGRMALATWAVLIRVKRAVKGLGKSRN